MLEDCDCGKGIVLKREISALRAERDALAAALERANDTLKAGGWLYAIDPAKPAAILAARDDRIRREAKVGLLRHLATNYDDNVWGSGGNFVRVSTLIEMADRIEREGRDDRG